MSNVKSSGSKVHGPILAALDIGSSKVSFLIGALKSPEKNADKYSEKYLEKNSHLPKIEIAGLGTAPNSGMKQGVVVNIEATTDSIRKAREEAELMSGYKAESVWVAISGSHIHSFDSRGMVAIKNKEVMPQDIERVLEAAKAVAVPADRTVLHVLPRDFKIDGQDGISDPIGMSGVRLEASVHIVTAAQAAISNTMKCIEKAGLKVEGLVLDQLASSFAVLSDDEKNLGVCLVDIGGGSTKLIYFVNRSIAGTSLLPVGGQHFTQDVAIGLRTPQFSAELLKKKHGCAMASMVNEDESIEVEGVGGRKARGIPRRDLADVIEARAEETMHLIANNVRMSGLQPMLGSGVVLTGGASQLDGLVEMGEFIFDIPVRRGSAVPGLSSTQNNSGQITLSKVGEARIGGLVDIVKGSEFATVVGLLLYALNENKELFQQTSQEVNIGESIDGFTKKVKEIFGQWL